jgi:2-dehydro-3-deoxygluconokinase
MRHEILRGAAHADIILPSADEEMVHCGDRSPEETRERYLKNGSPTVVVKNGPGRIAAVGPSGTLSHEPEPITNVLDTTAAGDSFNAGFLAAYLTGADLRSSIAKGAELAGKVVQHYGALVPLTG